MIAIPKQIIFQPHHADLVFDEETHTYKLRSTGEVLQGVTSILKAEGIQQYGPRNSAADFAMQVGTWVHQTIAWFEHGTLDESSLSEGIAPYLESYKKFRAFTGFRPILPLIETPMWHPNWRFCGMPDLPGVIANRFVVGDLKCGAKRAGDTVQVAAYGDLVMSSVVGMENVYPEGIVIYLQDDGSMPKLEKVSAEEMHQNLGIFISALRVNRWKKAHNQANE
jgi:hypothetical protein